MQAETGERSQPSIFVERHAAPLLNAVILDVKARSVQVLISPIENDLESVVEFGKS